MMPLLLLSLSLARSNVFLFLRGGWLFYVSSRILAHLFSVENGTRPPWFVTIVCMSIAVDIVSNIYYFCV